MVNNLYPLVRLLEDKVLPYTRPLCYICQDSKYAIEQTPFFFFDQCIFFTGLKSQLNTHSSEPNYDHCSIICAPESRSVHGLPSLCISCVWLVTVIVSFAVPRQDYKHHFVSPIIFHSNILQWLRAQALASEI